ncbi:MAG: hypothetical protein EPN47_18585 [Acidobacteria bacterium]|nr:MAG: hypothetical protein EPN47_18585 [Acidobacteriota bacterium]
MIELTELIWEKLLDEFRWPDTHVERVAYIDGVACGEVKVATTLTLPRAEMHPTYFTVSGEAMSEAGRHFRRFGMERFVQVHTHPGKDVRHSRFDSDNAYSQMDGAISIVLPYHARRRPKLSECGVYVRGEFGWRRLRVREIEHVIRILPGCLDFRRN